MLVCAVIVSCPSDVLCSCFISELVHCGRKLKDYLTLDACGIQSGSTIHILKKTWPEPESSPGLCVCHLFMHQHFVFKLHCK